MHNMCTAYVDCWM